MTVSRSLTLWVAAGDAHQVNLADGAGDDRIAHGAVRRIEAPVETDVQRHTGLVDGRQRRVDGSEVL